MTKNDPCIICGALEVATRLASAAGLVSLVRVRPNRITLLCPFCLVEVPDDEPLVHRDDCAYAEYLEAGGHA